MLLGGDELGRTQHGNNNAYCQDNAVSWFDWDAVDHDLAPSFTRARRVVGGDHPALRRRGWFQGIPIRAKRGEGTQPDLAWIGDDGNEMADDQWQADGARSVQLFLNGRGLSQGDQRGQPIIDDTFLIVFHGQVEDRAIHLPTEAWGTSGWRLVMNTERGFVAEGSAEAQHLYAPGSEIAVRARSLWLFRREGG